MYPIVRLIAVLVSLMPCALVAAIKPVVGKDYQVIQLAPGAASAAAAESDAARGMSASLTVTEFFSYGCPWCYRIEPLLMKWVKHLPDGVLFSRTPVVFEKDWDMYAKAFYTAQNLHEVDRLSSVLFEAVQDKQMSLATPQRMADFFVEQGIELRYAQSAFLYSAAINAKVAEGINLTRAYAVTNVPALVVAGHYRVDLAMAKGDVQRMLDTADYLIHLADGNEHPAIS